MWSDVYVWPAGKQQLNIIHWTNYTSYEWNDKWGTNVRMYFGSTYLINNPWALSIVKQAWNLNLTQLLTEISCAHSQRAAMTLQLPPERSTACAVQLIQELTKDRPLPLVENSLLSSIDLSWVTLVGSTAFDLVSMVQWSYIGLTLNSGYFWLE